MTRRGQGEGSIYQLKSGPRAGTWRGYVQVGYGPQGPIRKTYSAPTRPEVARKIAAALADHQRGSLPPPSKGTVASFLTDWLQDVIKPSKRPATYRMYERAVRLYINPKLGTHKLDKLTPQHVQGMLAAMRTRQPPLSGGTQRHARAVLIAALHRAMRWGLVHRNVAALTDPPPIEAREPTFWNQEQARAFLTAASGHRLEALFVIAVSMGLRRGEILGLRWRDINLSAGTLTVSHTLQWENGHLALAEPKTKGSAATITLPRIAADALLRHKAAQAAEGVASVGNFVFITRRGQPFNEASLSREYRKLVAKAGVPLIRVHDLRHSYGSLLLASGVDIKTVSTMLRHSSIQTTANTYVHVYQHMKQDAANKMDELLGQGG